MKSILFTLLSVVTAQKYHHLRPAQQQCFNSINAMLILQWTTENLSIVENVFKHS